MSDGTVQDQIQWLVRKHTPIESDRGLVSGFTVMGPYLTDQVREMLTKGVLEADDELCPENGYWFSMNESVEIRRFFGMTNIVIAKAEDEEDTQPDLVPGAGFVATGDEKTPSSIENVTSGAAGAGLDPEATGVIVVKRTPPPKPAAASAPSAGARPVPTLVSSGSGAPAGGPPASVDAKAARPKPTSVQELSRQYQRIVPQAQPTPQPEAAQEDERSASILGIEKSNILAVLVVAGLVLAALGVLWLIKSLRA